MRVGIDVGGTFTDLVATDSGGEVVTLKVPSTPREPAPAAIHALAAPARPRCDRRAVEFLAHSTTIATNALLGQLGLELPRVALVTTARLSRRHRDRAAKPQRRLRSVRRAAASAGGARRSPHRARTDRRRRRRPRFHSTRNRSHASARGCSEAAWQRWRSVCCTPTPTTHTNGALRQRSQSALPSVRIARSSEVDPQYREYERFSTTVVNAALAPIVERYLERSSSSCARAAWKRRST